MIRKTKTITSRNGTKYYKRVSSCVDCNVQIIEGSVRCQICSGFKRASDNDKKFCEGIK